MIKTSCEACEKDFTPVISEDINRAILCSQCLKIIHKERLRLATVARSRGGKEVLSPLGKVRGWMYENVYIPNPIWERNVLLKVDNLEPRYDKTLEELKTKKKYEGLRADNAL